MDIAQRSFPAAAVPAGLTVIGAIATFSDLRAREQITVETCLDALSNGVDSGWRVIQPDVSRCR
jgi:hypothetical protein